MCSALSACAPALTAAASVAVGYAALGSLDGWAIMELADLGAASEVARIDLKKSAVADRVDQFTIKIDKDPAGGGVLTATWENTQYSAAIASKK